MRRKLLGPLLLIAGLAPGSAARADTTNEFWPELQAFWRLDPSTRMLFKSAPTRSSEADERAAAEWGLYLDYREPRDPASYRVGYVYSVGDPRGPVRLVEHRIVLDYDYRWKVGESGRLSDRTRLDLRDKEGRASQRLRNRLQYEFDTQLGETLLVPFANVELYYDTRYHTIARYKLELGAVFVPSPSVELSPYYARQLDTHPHRANVNALGLTLTFHF